MKPINPKVQNLGGAPLGVDFGTTNSAVSRYANSALRKGPENLNFPLTGSRLYPSIAFLDKKSGHIQTGVSAYNKRYTEPEMVIESVKRMIQDGTRYDLNGRSLSNVDVAEKIISDFIHEIKLTDHDMNPQIIVVTVPYYFGENENALIKQAAEKAIYEQFAHTPQVFLLPEPVAASLACIHDFLDDSFDNRIIFVYDIGGGTLDLTLVRIVKNEKSFEYEILANDGIATFGGDDIDNILYNYILSHEKIDFSHLDSRYKALNRARMLNECRQTKQSLSAVEETTFMCANLVGMDMDYIELNVSRDTLNALICGQYGSKRNMFNELTECVERLYSKAKINKNDVDYLLPVGGTSCIPLFRNQITKLHSRAKSIISTEQNDIFGIVANGACIYGAMKSDELFHTEYHPFPIHNSIERMKTRISHSLFLKKYNDKMDLLIESNSLSPARIEKVYYPSKFQDDGTIVDLDAVQLFQGQGLSRKKGSDIGSIDFSRYKIYSHGRKLEEIPICLVFEATDSLVEVKCTIPKSDIDGKDIYFTQTICQ